MSDTAANVDRRDPEVARALVRRVMPDPRLATFAKRLFAFEISRADTIEPGSWMVSMWQHRVALNSGRFFVFGLDAGTITVTIDTFGLSGSRMAEIDRLGKFTFWNSLLFPEFWLLTVPAADMDDTWDTIESAHLSALQKSATSSTSSPYAKAHSPGFVEMLKADVGLKVFDPPRRTQR